jgi:hypothetical protein
VTSTIPAGLLELKARFETWRTNRKYVREPIPDELWKAAAELSRCYPPSLVGRVLKLDPSKLKKLLIKRELSESGLDRLMIKIKIALRKLTDDLRQITSIGTFKDGKNSR